MRRRVRTLVALATLLVLGAPVCARASTPIPEDVQVIDNVFGPRILRIPVGGAIEWTNEGRSLHDVVAADSEEDPPQRGVLIAGNWVHDNDNRDAAAKGLQYPTFGMGIVIAGGLDNLVAENLVEGHSVYGITVLPNIDANVWMSGNNEVKDNVVRSSGQADLALGAPTLGGDCFQGNDFSSSSPPAIEWIDGCDSPLRGLAGGSFGVTFGPLVRFIEAQDDRFVTGDWRTQPAPPPQPQMPSRRRRPPRSSRRSPCSGSRPPPPGGASSSACTRTRSR